MPAPVDLRGMYVAVAAATAAVAAAMSTTHLTSAIEHQILMSEGEMQKLIAEMSETSKRYLRDVTSTLSVREKHLSGVLERLFASFQGKVLARLESFIATHSVSGGEIKRVVADVLREQMTAAHEMLLEHMHALNEAVAAQRDALGMLAASIHRNNLRSQTEFMRRLATADTGAKRIAAAADADAVRMHADANRAISDYTRQLQEEFARKLDQMAADTGEEMKAAVQSALSAQSKALEANVRETLAKIESEKKESLSMEGANKKRKNSETGDWDRKMRDALDDLKAATTKILETKSEEHEKEFRDARDRGFYLGESVKKLELNTKEVLKSSQKTQTYLQSLEGNVNLLNETMRRVGIDDFRRRMFSGTQAAIAGKSQ